MGNINVQVYAKFSVQPFPHESTIQNFLNEIQNFQ